MLKLWQKVVKSQNTGVKMRRQTVLLLITFNN